MIFTLDDLCEALTADEIKQSIYDCLGIVGVTTTSWKPGAVVRTMIAASAIVLASLSSLIALIAKSGFLELASGYWLDLVAKYVFNVDRQNVDSFAGGTITIDNSSGNQYILAIGDLTVAHEDTGKTYTNSEPVTIDPSASGVECDIVATEAGSDSTALPDKITVIVSSYTGLTCTNEEAVIGLDAELDQALKIRCKEKTGALSPDGPRDAYAYFAKSAVRSDGTAIGVTRVRVVPDGLGGVDVYVATATGTVSGDPDDPGTDLGAVHADLLAYATPLGVTPRTHSATPLTISPIYSIYVYNTVGLTDAQLKDEIADALAAFMQLQPIGGNVVPPGSGKVYESAISAAISSTHDEIFRTLLTGGDVTVAATEVPVLGTITGVVTQLPPPTE